MVCEVPAHGLKSSLWAFAEAAHHDRGKTCHLSGQNHSSHQLGSKRDGGETRGPASHFRGNSQWRKDLPLGSPPEDSTTSQYCLSGGQGSHTWALGTFKIQIIATGQPCVPKGSHHTSLSLAPSVISFLRQIFLSSSSHPKSWFQSFPLSRPLFLRHSSVWQPPSQVHWGTRTGQNPLSKAVQTREEQTYHFFHFVYLYFCYSGPRWLQWLLLGEGGAVILH
jgi:hypothetical protein